MTTSTDALDWVDTPMTTPMRIGPVARSDDGTYVAIDSVWSGYEAQQFWRSTDGLDWAPATANLSGHPIFHIAFGHADSSTTCR